MINRGACKLYTRTNNWVTINTTIFSSGKIKTYWFEKNKSKYNRENYKKRYELCQKIMLGLKTNGCAICGYNKCSAALDFHHTNPEDKNFCIEANSMLRNDIKFAEEVNKCILLCSNCHRELHQGGRKC